MTRADRRCPDCSGPLETQLKSQSEGTYVEVFTCSNASNHGTAMTCANNCGRDVRHPREHWYSVKGRIGSGRWTCFPAEKLDWIKHAFD